MSRPTKTIKLSSCEVDHVEFLTWGEKELVDNSVFTGAQINQTGLQGFNPDALLEQKLKLMECAIKEIREGEKKIEFSKDWAKNLSVEDGEALYAALEVLTRKKDTTGQV